MFFLHEEEKKKRENENKNEKKKDPILFVSSSLTITDVSFCTSSVSLVTLAFESCSSVRSTSQRIWHLISHEIHSSQKGFQGWPQSVKGSARKERE